MERMTAAVVHSPFPENQDQVTWLSPALAHLDNDAVHAVLNFFIRFLLRIFK